MKSALVLLAVMGLVACSYAQILAMPTAMMMEDDGSWKPHLDGSVMGSGELTWLGSDLDDGSWKPHMDNSAAGLIYRRRRQAPADAPEVAAAKEAQLIQQKTEATRNLIGGIPLALPADTPEVAAGKQAHAIAHANELAMKSMIPMSMATPMAHIAMPMTARMMASPLDMSIMSPLAMGAMSPLTMGAMSPLAMSAISPLSMGAISPLSIV